MNIYDFSVNGVRESLNLPTTNLRFSWKIETDIPDTFQKSFSFVVLKNDNVVFDSGVVESDETCENVFEGLCLDYETSYTFRVAVTTNHGENATVGASFFTESKIFCDCKYIKPAKQIKGWSPYLRTKFTVPEKKIVDAKLWAAGLGVGDYYVNGTKINECYCEPISTDYEKAVLYRCYDVTEIVKNGGNCVAAQLGEGFYAQRRVWGGMVYGDECLALRLKITFDDGNTQEIESDDAWKYKYSQITENNIYGGEVYDARLETPDFALFEGDEDGWSAVIYDDTPKGKLTPCLVPEIKMIRELPCVNVYPACGKDDGAWVFDLGENFAGIYEFKIPQSPAGHVYTFRTTETVDSNGQVDHRSTGAMATQVIQQEIFISAGKPNEVYRPRFTYHGFRYLEMTGMHDFSLGYGTMPKKEWVKGLQLSTDLRRTGTFESDNEDINKLHGIMNNTFRSNYHGYPEDCPAREKCGWLGDAEVVCNWALYNYDMTSAFEKYLDDIRRRREVYGTWEMIAPGKRGCGQASPLWGCAQIIIPYWMWKYTGNKQVIYKNIDLMRLWLKHEKDDAKDFIIERGLGDWDPPSTPERKMPVPHSSTLMFYEISEKMAEISEAFGFGDEAEYRELAKNIKASMIKRFYDAKKHSYGYWGTNGAALKLGVYPDGDKEAFLNATVNQIKEEDYCMPTGIYGNKYLLPVLFDNGFGDVAMEYMFTRKHSSFGTMMDDNATTIWEDLAMTHVTPREKGEASYDHPMHGGCLYTYYANIAGIEPIKPGFKEFSIMPRLVPGINNVSCSLDTSYGKIEFAFERIDKKAKFSVVVPCGTSCLFTDFEGNERKLTSGKYTF